MLREFLTIAQEFTTEKGVHSFGDCPQVQNMFPRISFIRLTTEISRVFSQIIKHSVMNKLHCMH